MKILTKYQEDNLLTASKWASQDGKLTHVTNLANPHLINIWKMLMQRAHVDKQTETQRLKDTGGFWGILSAKTTVEYAIETNPGILVLKEEMEHRGIDIIEKPAKEIKPMKITNKKLKQCSKESGVAVSTLRYRLDKGMSLEEAMAKPSRKQNILKYTYEGRTMTAKEWAAELGITPQAFQNRTYRGLTGEKLFSPANSSYRDWAKKPPTPPKPVIEALPLTIQIETTNKHADKVVQLLRAVGDLVPGIERIVVLERRELQ